MKRFLPSVLAECSFYCPRMSFAHIFQSKSVDRKQVYEMKYSQVERILSFSTKHIRLCLSQKMNETHILDDFLGTCFISVQRC